MSRVITTTVTPRQARRHRLPAVAEWNRRRNAPRFRNTIAWRRNCRERTSRTTVINEVLDRLALGQDITLAQLPNAGGGFRRSMLHLLTLHLVGLPQRERFLHHLAGAAAGTGGKRREAGFLIGRERNFHILRISSPSGVFKETRESPCCKTCMRTAALEEGHAR